jgi:outer membrane immunogenic protein
MKKLVLAASILAASAVGASAADLAARPYTKAPPMMVAIYDWSGFYIGGNAGYGSSRKCFSREQDSTRAGRVVLTPALDEGCHNATGGVVGGQVGYRWQSRNWVFGLEAQGDWADLRGSNPLAFAAAGTNQTKIDSLGLFTGQVGYAWNNVLLYFKGGAALTHDKYNGVFTATNVVFDAASETRLGGVAGVGLEFGFTPNWSVAFEYDHLFMGGRSLDFTAVTTSAFSRTDRIRQDVDLATVRLNYRFGGPIVAKY